jgi:hypothetical protein
VQEPFSPELALIDPELARSLAWAPASRPAWTPAKPAESTYAKPGSASHTSPLLLLLLVSMAVNGYMLARALAAPSRPQLIAAPTETATAAAPESVAPGRSAAEQAVLSLVVKSPSSRLPGSLVDQTTGVPKNNLQAVCRGAAGRSFLCVVRPAIHKPGEGLYVRYRPFLTGKSRFTWSPYRRG